LSATSRLHARRHISERVGPDMLRAPRCVWSAFHAGGRLVSPVLYSLPHPFHGLADWPTVTTTDDRTNACDYNVTLIYVCMLNHCLQWDKAQTPTALICCSVDLPCNKL